MNNLLLVAKKWGNGIRHSWNIELKSWVSSLKQKYAAQQKNEKIK